MKNILHFILVSNLLLFLSCGVILDKTRIAGQWELDTVEFYVQNTSIDVIKTYYGTSDNTPSSDEPMNSEFFEHGQAENPRTRTYIMDFDTSNQLQITGNDGDSATTDDTFVPFTRGEWQLNQFDNSLLIHISGNEGSTLARGIWRDGFKLHLDWPMPDYDTLEIEINANDVGESYFSVDLSGKSLKVKSMKGIFKRQ